MRGEGLLIPGVKEGPLSSWEALEEYLDNPEFTPDIDEAWRLWKKRASRFVLATLGLLAFAAGSILILGFSPAGFFAAQYIGGAAFTAVIALPFYTWYEWATTKDRIEKWHREQAGIVDEPEEEEPQEELRWLYMGDRKW